ncbi:MAG: hypothetical protein AAFU03_10185 [Bacteroidota bacterium]
MKPVLGERPLTLSKEKSEAIDDGRVIGGSGDKWPPLFYYGDKVWVNVHIDEKWFYTPGVVKSNPSDGEDDYNVEITGARPGYCPKNVARHATEILRRY